MTWDVSPVWFSIRGIDVRYYSVLFLLMLFVGYAAWRWQSKRAGYVEHPLDLLYFSLAVIIGARMGQVVFYAPGYYFQHPLQIFNLQRGGLSSHGAAIAVALLLVYFARRENRPFLDVADRVSFSICCAIILVRIGNFFNSEVVGKISKLAWAVKFPRYDTHMPAHAVPSRHPSQLYEALLGLLVLSCLIYLYHRQSQTAPPGRYIATILVLYFGGRFFIEFTKQYKDPAYAQALLTPGQYLSIVPIVVGGLLFYRTIGKTAATK